MKNKLMFIFAFVAIISIPQFFIPNLICDADVEFLGAGKWSGLEFQNQDSKEIIIDNVTTLFHGDGTAVLKNKSNGPIVLEGYNDQDYPAKPYSTMRGSIKLQKGEITAQSFNPDIDIMIRCKTPDNTQVNCSEYIEILQTEDCPKGITCKYKNQLNLKAGD